ncbi:MAG: translation initiation factor IF-2 [Lentisphaeria bacterium]|nr:translation initiation factor IF-2 [Lentisphaeria bacterium]
MATTPIKVKAFADKYGLTSKEVLKELAAQGYENIRTASNNIPAEDLPLIESYFDELMEKRNPQNALIEEVESRMESRSGGQTKNKKRSGEEQNQGGKRDKNFGKGGKFPPRDNNGGNAEAPAAGGEIHIKPPVVVKALADAMGKRPNEVISSLMMMNVLASINQTIDTEVAQKVAEKMGFTLVVDSKRDKDEHQKKEETEEVDPEDMEYDDSPKDLKPRPPIVTFMGHVDHGKTSLQDAIRKTHVAAGEAGGITQHIGASSVVLDGRAITFVDTPGHEAFTQMRARGANVTDIVVLVVAADDGFMPQTIEAMNHALAAKVPIVVAMNKCDLPDADTQKILLHMQQNNLMSEDWGGTVAAIPVSAKTGAGIDDLLERILLEAEMLELQANAKRPGLAYVLESQLEQGLGATASVVVKNGSLRVGDPIICGEYYGKIKTLIDFRGKRVAVAPPSTPVKVVGLSGVPEAGTKMAVCKNINEAKQLAEARGDSNRIEALSSKTAGTSLEDLFSQMDDSKKNSLKVIVKSDVRGSSEAIVESLRKLPSEKISVDVLHTGVGAITENDVLLAASSDAIVVGFHVRVNPGVNDLAKKSNVEIRLYSIIYELIEDITDALAGRLEPEKREKDIGTVKILKIFQLSKGPKICGCMVEKGVARTGAKARVFRNNELIFNGEVRSLRRYQDDVKEVHQGLECGIRLDNFMDFTEGDIIQLYEIELKKATLT